MQLAATTAVTPSHHSSSREAVSPSKLFELASRRFRTSLAALEIGGPGAIPSAQVTTLAIQEAEAGMRALQSTLVPPTPFWQRLAADASIGEARRAVELLVDYRHEVMGLPDRPLRRDDATQAGLHRLDEARVRLGAAIARL